MVWTMHQHEKASVTWAGSLRWDAEWRPRKEAYIAHLPAKQKKSLLVSLADKTHNAEPILSDYLELGDNLWPRFNGGADGTRYYESLAEVFARELPGPLADRFSRAVAEFSAS